MYCLLGLRGLALLVFPSFAAKKSAVLCEAGVSASASAGTSTGASASASTGASAGGEAGDALSCIVWLSSAGSAILPVRVGLSQKDVPASDKVIISAEAALPVGACISEEAALSVRVRTASEVVLSVRVRSASGVWFCPISFWQALRQGWRIA